MTKIAINATHFRLTGMDGLNRNTMLVVSELEKLQQQALILTSVRDLSKNTIHTTGILSTPGFKGNVSRFIWSQTTLPKLLKKHRVSVYYSPVAEGMMFPVCKQIITIHDIIPSLFPEQNPRLRYYFKYILPVLLKKSDMIITMSHSTQQDLMEHYGIDEKKMTVIYQGYDDAIFYRREKNEISRVKAKYGIDSEFLLAVGDTRPYKNMAGLIEAFSNTKADKIILVIVGKVTPSDKSILNLLTIPGMQKKVKFLGFVPDDDLACLYSGARGFVFPSLYEGFGLPPLEAMACGTAIIASNTSSIPEVCGEAALYFDPHKTEKLTFILEDLINHDVVVGQLREKSIQQASQFKNVVTAKQVHTLIHNALNF